MTPPLQVSVPCASCPLFTGYGPLFGSLISKIGFTAGSQSLCSFSVEAWFSTAKEILSGAGGDQLHVMVVDVIKSFDTLLVSEVLLFLSQSG